MIPKRIQVITVYGPQYVGGPQKVGFDSNENSDLYIRRNELIFGYFLYSCFWLPKI